MQFEPNTDAADSRETTGVSRRTVLRGAVVVGVAGVAATTLAACGEDDSSTDTGSGSSGAAEEGTIAKTSDIPVGGGQILDAAGQKIVITQPESGQSPARATGANTARPTARSRSARLRNRSQG